MILAAGFGKRMLPLTEHTPKPLLEVHGEPLIFRVLSQLAKAGIKDVVINHAYLGAQIVARCGTGEQWGVNIQYSAENEPLETAGGIVNALPLLGDEPFIVVNGDVYCDFDFTPLLQQPLKGALAHLVLVENPAQHPLGDFSLNGQYLTAKAEKTYTFSGISKIDPKLFDHCQLFDGPLAPILRKAMQEQLVTAQVYRGAWHDVGTPERLKELNQ